MEKIKEETKHPKDADAKGNPAFEVRDRRLRFTDDTDQTEEQPVERPIRNDDVQKKPQEEKDAAMPVTFASFILSLATSALMHLGQGVTTGARPMRPAGGPSQEGTGSVHLPLARQVIDLISLLEEKTKGNRTSEEEEMLAQTLFALRIKFVEIEKKLRNDFHPE